MSHPIRVDDETYAELMKLRKAKHASFTDVIREILHTNLPQKVKT